MVVASGQMPYEFDTSLPVRALPNAWPGLGRPNISTSGDTFEQGMFVLNAEIRKWDVNADLGDLTYQAYMHPDIASSGFEPKANGETLVGLVGPTVTELVSDNIEQMRTNLEILFDEYANDSVYVGEDFMQAWLQTAYPESPSGSLVIHAVIPNIIYSFLGRTFLRPADTTAINGDVIGIDLHYLGGSGVLFDIDCGEPMFNPFPFPREGLFTAPSTNNFRVRYGPVYPLCQNTLGNIPSMVVSRYESDTIASYALNHNFAALGSGKVQIDGYCLLPGTTMELVKGNDTNFGGTLDGVNDYTDHVEGLRVVNDATGLNDGSARCYRTPSAQSSGLYRLITYNKEGDVPFTSIPSGFVSMWPRGMVTKASDGTLQQGNDIDGQQLIAHPDGTFSLEAGSAQGIHVFDDAIWLAGTNIRSLPATPNTDSRGMFCVSPFDGSLVWYRPAEMTVATAGDNGVDPGAFGTHVGLMDIGGDYVRLSLSYDESLTFNPSPASDTGVYTFYWQKYDKQTLNYTETASNVNIVQDGLPDFSQIRGALSTGSTVYTWREFGHVHVWSTALAYVSAAIGSPGIAGRRHYAGGDLLYTITGNIEAGDPLLSMTGGVASGIGKWSISGGTYTHDSAKPLRAEHHFGDQAGALINSIFDVTGATHVRDGIWMIVSFPTGVGITNDQLFLCRIEEGASEWLVVESYLLNEVVQNTAGGLEFPIEGILQDLDN